MKKFLQNPRLILFSIVVLCALLFYPGFFTYFHQDDFIHLSYSQTLGQVLSAFNIFQKGDFPFYRPIPTQFYFYFGKLIFGFNPFGFHLINFFIFSLNIFLVYRLIKMISRNETVGLIASVFFAVNSTHFAPLYSPAYIHELFYVLFGVLTVERFLIWNTNHHSRNYIFSIAFFILALMSKETAVVLPAILILVHLFFERQKKFGFSFKIFLPFLVILAGYLIAHFYYYGIASGPSYQIMIGKQTFNILAWYFFWALSTPNILIDFVGPGLKLSNVFFQVAGGNGWLFILLFPILLLLFLILLFQSFKSSKLILFGILWFIIGMIPLIIFPLHKLATEQAFSLVGLSLSLAVLYFVNLKAGYVRKLFSLSLIIIYFLIATNSILLARRTHWIVRSAKQARTVIDYIKTNYPNLSEAAVIYFRNGEIKIPQYGSSKQVYQSLGNGVGLKIALNRPNLQLYFEDIKPPAKTVIGENTIELDSSKFLGY